MKNVLHTFCELNLPFRRIFFFQVRIRRLNSSLIYYRRPSKHEHLRVTFSLKINSCLTWSGCFIEWSATCTICIATSSSIDAFESASIALPIARIRSNWVPYCWESTLNRVQNKREDQTRKFMVYYHRYDGHFCWLPKKMNMFRNHDWPYDPSSFSQFSFFYDLYPFFSWKSQLEDTT